MIEYHILSFLEDQGALQRGSDGFVTFLPDKDSVSVGIYAEPGVQRTDTHHFDSDVIGIQFRFQGKSRSQVNAKALQVHRTITALGSVELSGADGEGNALDPIFINDTHIVNAPAFVENDEKNRLILSSHYMVHVNLGGNLLRKMTLTETINA